MRLYWTFPHESINGVLKKYSEKNSNHRNVGTSLMKRHFLFRFLTVTLSESVIPPSCKVIRQGSRFTPDSRMFNLVNQQQRITVSTLRNVAYMYNWQNVYPDTLITFCDYSVWMSIDVINFDGVIRILARKTRFRQIVNVTRHEIYSFTDQIALLDIRDVLYTNSYRYLNDKELILKTFSSH